MQLDYMICDGVSLVMLLLWAKRRVAHDLGSRGFGVDLSVKVTAFHGPFDRSAGCTQHTVGTFFAGRCYAYKYDGEDLGSPEAEAEI
mgnify:CR=1 FL=1